MALEKQYTSITANSQSSENTALNFQPMSAESIRPVGSMKVSFYHIPFMSSLVEASRVRKALLPFAEQLLEHTIDLHTRHLIIYHHHSVDEITVALQRLSLGAELQQTLSHYEPLEVATFQQENGELLNQDETLKSNFYSIQQFLSSALVRLKQWIKVLQNKKDE